MLKFAKFIGANTDFATAQAFLFPRVRVEDSEEPVFGLVISGEGEDVFVKIRQQILNLESEFSFGSERITDKLHALSEILKDKFSDVKNLKLTLFCAKDNVFYVLQIGSNIVKILRGGKDFPVTSDQEKVVSGFIKDGDRILVLSARPALPEGGIGEVNWSEEVVNQIFSLPDEGIDDAEVIFATSEQKEQNQEDLVGVKNIEPVAFILIENQLVKESGPETEETSGPAIPKPRINFKIKLPSFDLWIFLHRVIRRSFALLRKTNKKLLGLIGILILILSISGSIYLFWQKRTSSQNTRFNNLIASLETNLNEAGSLKDSDAKLAAEKITQAKSRLKEAESLDPENSKIGEMKIKFDQKEAEILKIYKNLELELFMSLDLIKQTFKTQKMSFSVGKILLLDTSDKSLVAIDTQLKIPNILAGSQQLGNAQLASLNGSHAFVYSSDKGIVHIDIDTKKASNVASPDPEWGNVVDIFGFAGNAYVLDSGNPPAGGQIWKYAPTISGYSDKQEYLRGEANLGLGKRLVIDYSVWVLTSEPDILKFTAGNSDFYAMAGLNEPLEQIDSLFVPEDLDSVFILDKSTNRILVTKKNGEYLAQYINEQFSKVDDFFVDEELKAIYLLIENKIYRTPLR